VCGSRKLGGRLWRSLTPADFPNASELFEGADVLVIGYPGAVGPQFWTRAVVRSGVVAWIDPVKPLERTFLVDAMVFPGNSGGPGVQVSEWDESIRLSEL